MVRLRTSGILMAGPVAMVVSALALALSGCNEDDVERSLGQQTAVAVEREYGVNTDPVLAGWANALGHRLVGQTHRQTIEYSFKVVNTDMVNAFAAPWGYVYLTRGLMGFAHSEDEVAFVLGHEIGHVANRDAIKSVKQGLLFSIAAAVLGDRNRTLGEVAGLGAGLMLLHYSRGDESDADVSGAMTCYGAGYDPAGGEAFFARLAAEIEKGKPSRVEHLFLTHPETPRRIAAMRLRPELNLKDPAVASHIGRGYARRYAFAKATKYYSTALKLKPEATATQLAVAEAYTFQGLSDQARQAYQAVLARDAGNALAAAGLSALAAVPALPAPGEAERQAATAALSDVYPKAEAQTEALVETAKTFAASTGPKLAGASGVARQSISSLMGFADMETELSQTGQKAFTEANAAVSVANDAAFTLESVSGDVTRVRDLLTQVTAVAHQALTGVAAGQGAAGDAGAYQRALIETAKAAQQLAAAARASQDSLPLVGRAGAAGSDTLSALGTMLRASDHDRYVYPVRTLAAAALSQAQTAREATGKIKQMSQAAEARGLLAKLNLSALGASSAVRQAYDGMVAHYCGVQPQSVRALREQGLGFGDAAFVLSAAQANRVDASSYLTAVKSNQVVDGLSGQGVTFEGPVLLLRFLVNAVDEEAAARGSS
jgi:predicted Zn-dependent protease